MNEEKRVCFGECEFCLSFETCCGTATGSQSMKQSEYYQDDQ